MMNVIPKYWEKFPILLSLMVLPLSLYPQEVYVESVPINRITNAYPCYSPDGKKIAFMSNADGDFDVYVLYLEERRIDKLTDEEGRDGTPVWSPDGKQIAFQSFRDGNSQIYVMNADGSNQRNISNNSAHEEHPFWSSDGKYILFDSNRHTWDDPELKNQDIYRMRSDGKQVKRITNTPKTETYPSWSPDGSKIVCRQVVNDDNWEIFVMDADGSNMKNISNKDDVDGWPVWSPSGKHIAFASVDDGMIRIYVMRADGTNMVRITDDHSGGDRQPWWHPDGDKLVYTRYEWFPGETWYEKSDIHVVNIPPAALR